MDDKSLAYMKKQKDKNDNVRIYDVDAFEFMMLDLEKIMSRAHGIDRKRSGNKEELTRNDNKVKPEMIRTAIEMEKSRKWEEQERWYRQNYAQMSLLDIFSSGLLSEQRKRVIQELIQQKVEDEVIKNIIHPALSELEVQEKKKAWLQMNGK